MKYCPTRWPDMQQVMTACWQHQSVPLAAPLRALCAGVWSQVQAEGRRNKVPLEKGFSQVSWLKLTKSGADLTGGLALIHRFLTTCFGLGQH